MKRYKLILVLLVFSLILVGCGNQGTSTNETPTQSNKLTEKADGAKNTDTEKPKETPADAPNPNEEKEEVEEKEEEINPYALEWSEKYPKGNVADKQNIYDKDGIKISLKQVEYRLDSIYVFYEVENNNDSDVEVGMKRFNTDGADHYSYMYKYIPAGKKAVLAANVYYYEMEKQGIVNIHNVNASFYIYDYGTDKDLLTENLSATTKLKAQEPKDHRKDGKLVYKDDNIAVWAIGLSEYGSEDEYGSNTLKSFEIFIENKLDAFLRFEISNFVINDYVNEAYLYKEISNKGAGVGEIEISNFDLDNTGVKFPEGVKTIEFKITTTGVDDYEEYYTTGNIVVKF